MELSLPIYIRTEKPDGARDRLHVCAPLFIDHLTARHEMLSRAMQRLARDVRRHLDLAAKLPRHAALARLAFHPELESAQHKLELDLRDRTLKVRYLFVVMRALGRRIAFTPSLRDLWFELKDGERLQSRATEVLSEYFLRLLKDDPHAFHRATETSLTGSAWLSTLDLEIATRQRTRQEQRQEWAALWKDEEIDGAEELHKVGRCLDWLYPDDLSTAIGRESEVEQLRMLLAAPDRRPVLVVGNRLAGKTAVIEQCVYRRVHTLEKKNRNRRNVWLLSPGRLVSGMSYVGQWENRLLAILKESKKREHVLYFDDLLGLFSAGKSADSALAMADVLKPQIARREVRILAEMTPQSFDALQQRDRGLADEFHVLRIDDMGEAATLEVLLEVNRRCELQHRCRFDLDVLPTVMEIQHRYAPSEAFPGKAARMLSRLAARHRESAGEVPDLRSEDNHRDQSRATRGAIRREDVYEEFHRQTGMRLELIDRRKKLPQQEIVDGLRERMVGQADAVQAAAEVIALAKARLNPPHRPLASLLFLGPTGVGKTECAKAIARYLFGDDAKLLRFDMNEFSGPLDAARLVGTFYEPDGLLTGAVRRQPFSVVLLDEIEKAHPDVFDLLLQVLGEGRLTDAVGRTTDFHNTIVILTSNLGTKQAAATAGFGSQQIQTQQATFTRAAEQFFSPELFNRFDRVLPFTQLERAELKQIAQHLIREVFQREGLVRRRCLLHVDPQAMEAVIDQGYHPEYGARVLKRTIESQLTLPVAKALAGMKGESPTMIRLFQHGAGITTQVSELREVQPVTTNDELPEPQMDAQLTRAESYLQEVEGALEPLRPRDAITAGSLTPAQLHYFALKEQHVKAGEMLQALRAWQEHQRQSVSAPSIVTGPSRRSSKEAGWMEHGSARRVLRDIYSVDDIVAYFAEFAAESGDARQQQSHHQRLRDEFALLATMHGCPPEQSRALLVFEPLAGVREREFNDLVALYLDLCVRSFEFDCEAFPEASLGGEEGGDAARCYALEINGACARALLAGEAGLHVFVDSDDSLSAIGLHVLALDHEESPESRLCRIASERANWLANLRDADARDDKAGDQQPYPAGEVLRVYRAARGNSERSEADKGVLDLRTRLTSAGRFTTDRLRQMILRGLSSPPGWEVSDAVS